MYTFDAPWGTRLKVSTFLSLAIMLGLPLYFYLQSPEANIAVFALPAIILISAFFMVRGYELQDNFLYVHRLFWKTKIDLTDLQEIKVGPELTAHSIRTFGNGGLFAFTGRFRNRTLGSYRGYITDHKNAVALVFSGYSVVVSPGQPLIFEQQIRSLKKF